MTDQPSLRRWARRKDFKDEFKGRVKGLGFAVYYWLLMRLGVDTIKPDSRVKTFLRRASGRHFTDEEAVSVLERAARDMGWKARMLDWSIWENEKAR